MCPILMTDSYGIVPGLTTSRETYEAEFRWGSQFQGVFTNALIDGSSLDVGNSPTFELRPGLLLGQNLTTGKFKPYAAGNTDGTEVATGVLIEALRMQDFSGNNVDRFYAVLVGGPVQASKLLGLDLNAIQQMDKFIFDTSLRLTDMPGGHWYPFKRFQTKTANYSIIATDNYNHFDNLGASAEVDITLPPIANGYYFGFTCMVDQTFKAISNEGANIVTFNNAVGNQVSYATPGSRIGGTFRIYTNPAATKWIVEQIGSNTLTVA